MPARINEVNPRSSPVWRWSASDLLISLQRIAEMSTINTNRVTFLKSPVKLIGLFIILAGAIMLVAAESPGIS